MKKATVILLTLAITLTAGWWKTYGDEGRDIGCCIQPTADGNYIIAGRTSEYGDYGWLLKINPDGDTIWTRVYQEIRFTWITQASDGGYIISGEMEVGDAPSMLKVDSVGDELWTRPYDLRSGGCANYVGQTSDGGFILTGYATMPPIQEETDLLLVKTDSNGDTIWTKLYNSYWGLGIGSCVKQTNDGGYIVCGNTSGLGGVNPDLWLLKTDPLGDTLWTRSYGYLDNSSGESLDITDDGGYIITGYDKASLWLLRTNSSGDTLWTKRYLGKGFAEGKCVLQVEDGGYIITGFTGTSSIEGHAVLLLKTDESGNILWARTYADQSNDIGNAGYCVQETDDKGYIVVGGVHQGTISGDLYLLKTDSLGLLGVSEPPVTHRSDFEVVSTIGMTVTLRFADCPGGFSASIFDASGRMVDEIHSSQAQGTLQWGGGRGPGVYFIREMGGSSVTQKVVLVK